MMRHCTLALLVAFAPGAGLAAACQIWTQVKSPDISMTGDNTFAAIAGTAPDDVWAVGQYIPNTRPNITRSFTAHYDGKSWSNVESPNDGPQANALHQVTAVPNGEAWAVGYSIDPTHFLSRTLILHWDRAAWHIVPHPVDPGLAAVLFGVHANSAHDIWAVGEYEQPIDNFHTLIEHFDGSSWTIVPSPDPGATGNILYSVTARGNEIWAVGESAGTRGPDRALILTWNGAAWHPAPSPPDGFATTRLYRIAADGLGTLHASGEAENDPVGTLGLAEAATPNHGFAVQRVAHAGSFDNNFYGIGAAPDGTAWAVGATSDAKGRQFTLIEREAAGGRWNIEPSPSPSRAGSSLLADVAAIGHDVWAVGAFDGPQAQRSLILHSCR